jgi:hypothetical protein
MEACACNGEKKTDIDKRRMPVIKILNIIFILPNLKSLLRIDQQIAQETKNLTSKHIPSSDSLPSGI